MARGFTKVHVPGWCTCVPGISDKHSMEALPPAKTVICEENTSLFQKQLSLEASRAQKLVKSQHTKSVVVKREQQEEEPEIRAPDSPYYDLDQKRWVNEPVIKSMRCFSFPNIFWSFSFLLICQASLSIRLSVRRQLREYVSSQRRNDPEMAASEVCFIVCSYSCVRRFLICCSDQDQD